jgi:hypothetical protein
VQKFFPQGTNGVKYLIDFQTRDDNNNALKHYQQTVELLNSGINFHFAGATSFFANETALTNKAGVL